MTTMSIHEPTRTSRKIVTPWRDISGNGTERMRVFLRYDDSCGNGHNTFAITAETEERRSTRARWLEASGGCLHDAIRKHFPGYAHLIRWHLVSTDGPMHYIANTMYWAEDKRIKAQAGLEKARAELEAFETKHADEPAASFGFGEYGHPKVREHAMLRAGVRIAEDRLAKAEPPNLENARNAAKAPDATLEQLRDEHWLRQRLRPLMLEFRAAMDDLFGEG